MSTDFDLRLRPNKVGSVCLPFDLGPYVTVHQTPVCEEGAAIACRVLTARKEYGHLELTSGRQARLSPGDLIVGALGNRAALRGFCGRVPTEVKAGDVLHLLNQGGVIGVSEGDHAGLGHPIELEVIGTPIRHGRGLRLREHAIARDVQAPDREPPVLVFAGTCMNSGKTTAAAVITRYLRSKGRMVHAGKVTGVAAIKDLLLFADNGATKTLSFLDCGLPSTCYHDDIPDVAQLMLAHLSQEAPDLIVLEMGDGLMGDYGVDEVLADPRFVRRCAGAVFAANDVIGAVAGARQLEAWGIPVRVVTGPATDNAAGTRKLEDRGLNAANIFLDPARVCRLATQGVVDVEDPH
ncbi:MAG: hypothetical protein H6733_12500 [Alphaproteobacteria bacterium]|nr:hypothetical protein [Alphaproteobacteria bacterium]